MIPVLKPMYYSIEKDLEKSVSDKYSIAAILDNHIINMYTDNCDKSSIIWRIV